MLGRLITGLGERSTYDAVAQCSRCGYCEQACPTYLATGREGFNPRGRNQAVRMLIEHKIGQAQTAEQLLSTCLLCGACSTACYAHVRTPDLVLEGRRLLREGQAPPLARLLGWLLLEHPRAFESLLKVAYFFKRLGLARLACRLGLPSLVGLPGLAVAEEQVSEAPRSLLAPELRARPELRSPAQASFLYFAPCGPNFVLPRVGRATVRVLSSRGKTAFADIGCCGLLAYNYGDVGQAREFARRVIERAEAAFAKADKAAVLVGDCSSCVAHMKGYPQLFLEDPGWKPRAEAFAARVKDIIELLPSPPKAGTSAVLPFPPTAGEGRGEGSYTYHDSCRAKHGQGISKEPRAALAGRDLREMAESDSCCGGAGAFAFVHPDLSDAVLRRKVSNIASTQARVVAASATSCLLHLAHGLSKYYPECRVVHLSELAAESLPESLANGENGC